jgi:hypothetical protein
MLDDLFAVIVEDKYETPERVEARLLFQGAEFDSVIGDIAVSHVVPCDMPGKNQVSVVGAMFCQSEVYGKQVIGDGTDQNQVPENGEIYMAGVDPSEEQEEDSVCEQEEEKEGCQFARILPNRVYGPFGQDSRFFFVFA